MITPKEAEKNAAQALIEVMMVILDNNQKMRQMTEELRAGADEGMVEYAKVAITNVTEFYKQAYEKMEAIRVKAFGD